jgi:hypothetical protein
MEKLTWNIDHEDGLQGLILKGTPQNEDLEGRAAGRILVVDLPFCRIPQRASPHEDR